MKVGLVNRPRLITVAVALTLGTGLAVPAAAATVAPAVNGAASGGAVIVVLKDQHATVPLKTTQRTTDTRSDQQSIVSDMKANGGTSITQLISVNAVAAHLSAEEVSRLQSNPAVAQIVPDDTIDIALRVAMGVLLPNHDAAAETLGDGVDANESPFQSTFPFIAYPHSGSDASPH